jgi:hypothetical protein
MGYYMEMREVSFEIPNENKEKALELLKTLARKNSNLSWVDSDTVLRSETLSEALDECSYDIEEDESGNVINIYFTGEKLGDDELIFDTIASTVKDGSYIEMMGEDGLIWRWVFKGGKCKEINAKIQWDE